MVYLQTIAFGWHDGREQPYNELSEAVETHRKHYITAMGTDDGRDKCCAHFASWSSVIPASVTRTIYKRDVDVTCPEIA